LPSCPGFYLVQREHRAAHYHWAALLCQPTLVPIKKTWPSQRVGAFRLCIDEETTVRSVDQYLHPPDIIIQRHHFPPLVRDISIAAITPTGAMAIRQTAIVNGPPPAISCHPITAATVIGIATAAKTMAQPIRRESLSPRAMPGAAQIVHRPTG